MALEGEKIWDGSSLSVRAGEVRLLPSEFRPTRHARHEDTVWRPSGFYFFAPAFNAQQLIHSKAVVRVCHAAGRAVPVRGLPLVLCCCERRGCRR